MNKSSQLKNRDEIIRNKFSADFYILNLYSKEILDLDKLRVKDFSEFYRNNQINYREGTNWDKNRKIKRYFLNTMFSVGLIFYFKSFLVIPVFFSSVFLIKKITYGISSRFNCRESVIDNCYFCQRDINKEKLTENYTKYYLLINYIIEKNSKINNLDDFEKELDILIKSNV